MEKFLECLIFTILGIGFGLLFPMWLFNLEKYCIIVIVATFVLCYILSDKVEKYHKKNK